ncbi:MAG TPA: hypothetical protein VFB20_01580 [Burkholderiales bacterium]|nr:hypothetical protein [Burkholderiales bacterium]
MAKKLTPEEATVLIIRKRLQQAQAQKAARPPQQQEKLRGSVARRPRSRGKP